MPKIVIIILKCDFIALKMVTFKMFVRFLDTPAVLFQHTTLPNITEHREPEEINRKFFK
jgi:hypothetical protein